MHFIKWKGTVCAVIEGSQLSEKCLEEFKTSEFIFDSCWYMRIQAGFKLNAIRRRKTTRQLVSYGLHMPSTVFNMPSTTLSMPTCLAYIITADAISLQNDFRNFHFSKNWDPFVTNLGCIVEMPLLIATFRSVECTECIHSSFTLPVIIPASLSVIRWVSCRSLISKV